MVSDASKCFLSEALESHSDGLNMSSKGFSTENKRILELQPPWTDVPRFTLRVRLPRAGSAQRPRQLREPGVGCPDTAHILVCLLLPFGASPVWFLHTCGALCLYNLTSVSHREGLARWLSFVFVLTGFRITVEIHLPLLFLG